MSAGEILGAFAALLTPLGACVGVVYLFLKKRINNLEEENRELLGLLWEMSGENQVTRKEIGRVLARKREE